jgi:glucose-1-phosphate adenylyltransferase
MNGVIAMVLAGGKGERLKPLTDGRAKPAVPFGAHFRIIDFTLSNCINSLVSRIFVLTQYKSHSLSRHLKTRLGLFAQSLDQRICEIPAQTDGHPSGGTADAIRQNLGRVDRCRPEDVLILSGDHIYKMDYRQFRRFHTERKASLSIAVIRVPIEIAKETFGVIEVDEAGRVVGFVEKPASPKPIPGSGDCFASMGIYLFTTPGLHGSLDNDLSDFGQHIIPAMLAAGNPVYAWDYSSCNSIAEYEYKYRSDGSLHGRRLVSKAFDSDYWRDVGSIESYWTANLDALSAKPKFNLTGENWPLFHQPKGHPLARSIHAGQERAGMAVDSIVSNAVTISGSVVMTSVLGPGIHVHPLSEIRNSVFLGGSRVEGVLINTTVGRGCRIRNAIVDKCAGLPEGMTLGFDRKDDEAQGFRCVSIAGSGEHIVVVPRSWGADIGLRAEGMEGES